MLEYPEARALRALLQEVEVELFTLPPGSLPRHKAWMELKEMTAVWESWHAALRNKINAQFEAWAAADAADDQGDLALTQA